MKVSSKSRYAILALFDLAYHGDEGALRSKTIAERQGIPPRFLEQIFQDLRRAGLVSSRRGPRGGYVLAQEAAAIRLGDILRAVDGGVELESDSDEGDALAQHVTREVLGELGAAFDRALDAFSLADLQRRGELYERTLGNRNGGNRFAI